jgi:hypothetical protein
MEDIIIAKIKLPKLKTRIVWAGIYGGHYDQIVFFYRQPVKSTDGYYDTYDNKDLIAGDMGLSMFKELFPNTDLAKYYDSRGIEIVEVFKMELTTLWEKPYRKNINGKEAGNLIYRLSEIGFHGQFD